MMNETIFCQDYCYKKIYSKVEDTEPLISYVYDKKDRKVDKMFGGQNFSFACKDYALYYECPSVHKIKYFCRLVNVCKVCCSDKNDYIVHKLRIFVVMFNLVHRLHVTFRISIDITGKQYTNSVSMPSIGLEDIECFGLLLNIRDNERFINQTKQNILWVFNLLVDNYEQNVYKIQQFCFK